MAQPIYLDPELQGIEREKQLAQALQQRGMQPVQGQMVGNRYVAPSLAQYLANAYDVYSGGQRIGAAEKKASDYAEALRKQGAQDVMSYNKMLYGAPEQATYGAGMEGPTKQVTSEAVQADPNKAIQFALQSRNPMLQEMAKELLKPKTFKEGEVEMVFNPATGKREKVAEGGIKLPGDIQSAVIFLGLENKDPRTWTQQERAAVEAKANQFRQSGAVNLGQKGLDNTLKLRGDFRSEPTYKAFQEVDSAYRTINNGLQANSAAGDLAAATKLMKLLDPSSVVRESELVMAMKATGKLDQLYNYANKITTGQFLSPTQKAEFKALSNEFYNSAANQYNEKRSEYATIAERNQLNVEDVAGKPINLKGSPTKANAATPNAPTSAWMGNREIVVKGNQWVYKDTGEAVK